MQYQSPGNKIYKIYQFRKTLGLNKAQFGKIFDVSYMSVKNWESGKHDYPSRVLRIIRQRFNTNVDFFLCANNNTLYTSINNFNKDKNYVNKILRKEK